MKSYRAEGDKSWATRHNAALGAPRGFEIAVVYMLRGLHSYRVLHLARYECDVLDDGEFGDGIQDIARGVRTLLNGETGRLDCGTIDSYLCEIVEHD